MAEDNILSIKLIKRGGKMVYTDSATQGIHQGFIDALEEDQVVEIFFSACGDNGTYMQLSKIHPCIRKLANEIGLTFEEMKLQIKKEAGLVVGDYIKSFGDCTAEELSGVIQTIIQSGDFVNINFRGKLPDQDRV